MAEIIDMPKLSDTMTVGTLVTWLKNEGDKVEAGELLAEVETDKATMEVECFSDGYLIKQYVTEGSAVSIGSPICAIGAKDEKAPAVSEKTETTETPKEEVKPTTSESPKNDTPPQAKSAPSPQTVTVTNVAPQTSHSSQASAGRIMASPLARKMALDNNVELGRVKGTGPSGRIVKKDILDAINNCMTGSGHSSSPIFLEEKVIPVSNMRSTIARRLVESKVTIPHFYLEVETNATPLVELRAVLNNEFADLPVEQGGIKYTLNDLILKATAKALQKVPSVNSSWEGTAIRQHGTINLSFGVSIDDGLLTPVIQDAQNKPLREIALDAKSLIQKARAKQLKPNEMTGSTFTITNLGMFGISKFYGIINPPNAGILSIGSAMKTPVVDKNNNITIGHTMMLGFSGDHRVIDGSDGALFLKQLKDIIENPALILI